MPGMGLGGEVTEINATQASLTELYSAGGRLMRKLLLTNTLSIMTEIQISGYEIRESGGWFSDRGKACPEFQWVRRS